jgi:magnesium chelatase family protein
MSSAVRRRSKEVQEMFASVTSAVLYGAEGHLIHVEVQVASGLPGFSLVGLPDLSIRESRDRARAAVQSSGFDWPKHKITVNLAPSGDRKGGSGLDLAIAVGVLAASGVIPGESIERMAFIGELGLDGSLRPVNGVAPMVGAVGDRDVVVPIASAVEAEVVALGRVRLVANLRELVDALLVEAPWPGHQAPVVGPCDDPAARPPDLADVQGQPVARHALEIAAAGGHHTLFIGPPGAGKTMLAARLPGLLPPLDRERALEVTMVHSAAGIQLPPGGLVRRPPFRSPHHTSSQIALVGGGSRVIRPGEVSIAHGGVLFMDELAEFAPSVLDGLRQPLESRVSQVDRSEVNAVLPADFLLVAAMNPCPCGGGAPGACVCGDAVLHRYARRVSGPLLDRFDLRVPVHRPAIDDLLVNEPGESSACVAARVATARALAFDRQGCLNGALSAGRLDEFAALDPAGRALLRNELEHDRLSGRGYHRVRRVARTIADLRGHADHAVADADVAMALRFRATFARSMPNGRAA